MRKRTLLLLFLCLCLIGVFTTACGGGGKTTPPDNSAFYYLLAQQNANNNQPAPEPEPSPSPTEPEPSPSPTEPEPTPSPTEPEPTPSPTENPFANAQVGDFVEFGSYPQTSVGEEPNIEWPKQPIEWKVLARDDNNKRILVISRYGLDAKAFDDDSNVWGSSEICTWLNGDNEGDFYNTAFDDTEKGFIKPVGIVFNNDGTDYYDFNSATYKVFLLSGDNYGNGELYEYFADDEARKCLPTAYAKKNGAFVADSSYGNNAGYSVWWLRSPNPDDSEGVSYVDPDGYNYGYDFCNGSVFLSAFYVVRPALWINL